MATTLADLQTEREKLRADAAREQFEAALAETCLAEDTHQAAQAVRRLMNDVINDLPERLQLAIEGESDETRIHYLLSDAAHDLLREIGEQAASATEASLPELGEAVRQGVKPRDLLTVSQWADRHRVLKSGTNAPGNWRTDRNPHLQEIMDSLSEHSPVREVTFAKASGVGGTEVLYNWIGYIMHHLQNKDLLLVVPSLELRNRSLNPRLRKMITETPVLSELVTNAARSKVNRDDLLEYGAQSKIIKAGANSADSMRSDHVPYVAKDEASAYPWDIGGEGDPDILIGNRQRTFSRAKTYNVSTPTIEHQCRITRRYERSDQRKRYVPCPHCGHMHTLEFKNFQWRTALDDDADATAGKTVTEAWFACPSCGGVIEEGHKPEMFANAQWIPHKPKVKRHRGYHLNAFYAPIGLGETWREIAQLWLDAQDDTEALKSFVNTYLGEVWREKGDSIEDLSLISRLEDYTLADIPAVLIVAGVDVQKDRLELTVAAIGAGEEAWPLDHIILPGDTAQDDVWDDLDQTCDLQGVQYAAIDAGYNADKVYEFVATRSWCWATKGYDGMNRPLVEDERKRRQRLRYKRKKGAPVEPIGADQGKALVYARLKLQEPGKGYIHFPNQPAFDDEYFAQLAAEKLVPKQRRGRQTMEWVQTRNRNEALDCMVLCLVAARLSGEDLDELARLGRYVHRARGEASHQSSGSGQRAARQRKRSNTEFGSEDWAL